VSLHQPRVAHVASASTLLSAGIDADLIIKLPDHCCRQLVASPRQAGGEKWCSSVMTGGRPDCRCRFRVCRERTFMAGLHEGRPAAPCKTARVRRDAEQGRRCRLNSVPIATRKMTSPRTSALPSPRSQGRPARGHGGRPRLPRVLAWARPVSEVLGCDPLAQERPFVGAQPQIPTSSRADIVTKW
jgi:hypothetical protein